MKQVYIVIAATILIMSSSCSHSISSLESNQVYKTNKMGFSQANVYEGLLFSSGQVGWDTNYQLTGTGSFKDQINQTFVNINEILKEAGSNFNDVITIRMYVKNLDDQKLTEVGNIIKDHYPNSYKPTSSLIGVATLAREDLLVEIEIIAKTKK